MVPISEERNDVIEYALVVNNELLRTNSSPRLLEQMLAAVNMQERPQSLLNTIEVDGNPLVISSFSQNILQIASGDTIIPQILPTDESETDEKKDKPQTQRGKKKVFDIGRCA